MLEIMGLVLIDPRDGTDTGLVLIDPRDGIDTGISINRSQGWDRY